MFVLILKLKLKMKISQEMIRMLLETELHQVSHPQGAFLALILAMQLDITSQNGSWLDRLLEPPMHLENWIFRMMKKVCQFYCYINCTIVSRGRSLGPGPI